MARELVDLHIHVGGAGGAPRALVHRAPAGVQAPGEGLLGVRGADHLAGPATWAGWRDYLEDHAHLDGEDSVLPVRGGAVDLRGDRQGVPRQPGHQIELRFNPAKRNLSSELDLDHIIHAALRGMDRAMLEYDVKAGLIFCLAREFDHSLNSIIVDRRSSTEPRGGWWASTLAGTSADALELKPEVVGATRPSTSRARQAGLKTTVHTGETRAPAPRGVVAVVESSGPTASATQSAPPTTRGR